jgi:hypothetical protein
LLRISVFGFRVYASISMTLFAGRAETDIPGLLVAPKIRIKR